MDKKFKKSKTVATLLLAIQWTIFIFASSVVAPLAIGIAFKLSQLEISTLLQRAFFVMGVGTLLQVYFGHKLQISEGPAGLWWGVFLVFASLSSTLNLNINIVLRSIEFGLIIGGSIYIIMALLNITDKIKVIFTPIVTGTYLFLLIAQLSGPFIKGILGVGYLKPSVDGKVAILAIITLIFTAILAKSKNPKIKSFSILYGIIFGWILFFLFKVDKKPSFQGQNIFSFPKILAWGTPKFNISITVVCVITSLLLLSNLIASVEILRKVIGQKEEANYNKAGFIMGINQIMAGLFSTVGFVPVSSSAAFIETTENKDKKPFILGSVFIIIISFFPPITLFFASLPVPVGYATVFIAFANMISLSLKEYFSAGINERNLFIISVSLFIGIGSMFIPSQALKGLPNFLVPILNNGLIVGVLICIFVEQLINFKENIKDKKNI